MERGEDWEYEAVRNRWTAIERQERVTKRLVAAFGLGLVAVVLFLIAMSSEACIHGLGTQNTCQPVTSGPVFDVLVIASVGAVGAGVWLCRSALAIHHQYGGNGC